MLKLSIAAAILSLGSTTYAISASANPLMNSNSNQVAININNPNSGNSGISVTGCFRMGGDSQTCLQWGGGDSLRGCLQLGTTLTTCLQGGGTGANNGGYGDMMPLMPRETQPQNGYLPYGAPIGNYPPGFGNMPGF